MLTKKRVNNFYVTKSNVDLDLYLDEIIYTIEVEIMNSNTGQYYDIEIELLNNHIAELSYREHCTGKVHICKFIDSDYTIEEILKNLTEVIELFREGII